MSTYEANELERRSLADSDVLYRAVDVLNERHWTALSRMVAEVADLVAAGTAGRECLTDGDCQIVPGMEPCDVCAAVGVSPGTAEDAPSECPCGHDPSDISFDRSICACGAMHMHCNGCGFPLDCPYLPNPDAPSAVRSPDREEAC